MKRALAIALWVLAATALAGHPAAADEWTLRTGAHVDAWSGAGQSGHQVLAPIGLSYDTPDWGLNIRGALGTSERDPGGAGGAGSVSGFTDTTVGGYYRLTAGPYDIRFGLDLDLPTGKSALSGRDRFAVQDEDLALLERFGEGFDVNPTVTVYRSFGVFGLGLGVGYLWTGEYDPTGDVPGDDLDPGDELIVALTGEWFVTDTVRATLLLAYTYFTKDERGGIELYREGDEIDVRVGVEWRPEPWFAAGYVRNVVRFKSDRLDATGRLTTESRNSHGNDFRVGAAVGYVISDDWTVAGAVDVRYVAANDYASTDVLYDGGRLKVAIGPSVTWSPSRWLAVDAGVRYFFMDVERSPSFPRAGTINGVHADFRVTYRF
jgi:hypothetical protein